MAYYEWWDYNYHYYPFIIFQNSRKTMKPVNYSIITIIRIVSSLFIMSIIIIIILHFYNLYLVLS